MKKAIMFAVAVTLSGAVFASGLEDFKSQSNLTELDAKAINSADIIMPMGIQSAVKETVEGDKRVVWNQWSWDTWSWGKPGDNKRPEYFFQADGHGGLVCADKSGRNGYNKITVNKFLRNPIKGECADMRMANLRGYDLRRGILSGADLRGAELSWADLSKVNLIRAKLSGAKLYQTGMSRADLSEADLSKANLKGIYLSWAKLVRANLSSSDISEAIMIGADLSGADLSGAYLIWTDMSKTNLRGTNLSGVDLREVDLNGAEYNDKTILPFDDIEAKRRGMIKVK